MIALEVESLRTREWKYSENSGESHYRILWKVKLCKHHAPTGRTLHFLSNIPAPPPVELRIIQYPEDNGYYLFYCDDRGKEYTDTYHDSVEDAMRQAEREYNVKPEEWDKQ